MWLARASTDSQALWPEEVRDYRVLVADDVPLSLRSAREALQGLVHKPVMVESEASLVATLRDRQQLWDVVVVDRRLFRDRTIEVMADLERERRRPRVIVMGQLTDSARERTSLGKVVAIANGHSTTGAKANGFGNKGTSAEGICAEGSAAPAFDRGGQ
jgi:CheY-like chemotaxis protein